MMIWIACQCASTCEQGSSCKTIVLVSRRSTDALLTPPCLPSSFSGVTENAGQENAGLENDGQKCRAGKCRTGKWQKKVQGCFGVISCHATSI